MHGQHFSFTSQGQPLQMAYMDVAAKGHPKRIPQGRLIEFPGLGHAPQVEDPARFHQALLGALLR